MKIMDHDQFYYTYTVTPPMLVPATMSPKGRIFSNHSTWSFQVNKQVCDTLQENRGRLRESERERERKKERGGKQGGRANDE